MLKQTEVEINVGGNFKYYESLGYSVPKYKDNHGRMSVKRGTKIFVKFEDVPQKAHHIKIKVECDYCGKIYYPTIANYYRGHKKINKDACAECKYKKTQEIFLLEYNTTSIKTRSEIQGFKLGRNKKDGMLVYNDFMKRGYIPQFKPEDYINCKQKLPYICPLHKNKGILFITYDSFINSKTGCIYCAAENKIRDKRYSYEFVKSKFDEKDYILKTDEYKQVDQELSFICKRHPEIGLQTTTFWSVLNYVNNCKICRYNMQSGEFHWNWQGGISSEREQYKNSDEYKEWRSCVLERDNYTCQCCGEKNTYLEVHHIYNYSDYPDLRTDINNGITLCYKCHSINYKGSFHSVYTQFHNTYEQLKEYIQRFKNGEFDELRSQNAV